MFKRRKSILCLLIAVLMMASASSAAMAASPYETRYNNTVMATKKMAERVSHLCTYIVNRHTRRILVFELLSRDDKTTL